MHRTTRRASRLTAGFIALSLMGTAFGCGRPSNSTYAGGPPPPPPRPAPNSGPLGGFSNMSTGKKLAILAGTAALIYLYNKHKNAQGTGPNGQYYRSSNGRVYYRDANHQVHWVTPPAGGIQVPEEEARVYNQAAQRGDWNVNYGGSSGGGYAPAPSGPPGPPGPGRY